MTSDTSYPTMIEKRWILLLDHGELPGCNKPTRCPLLLSGNIDGDDWEECFLLRNTEWEGTSFSEVCCRVGMSRDDSSPTTKIGGKDE